MATTWGALAQPEVRPHRVSRLVSSPAGAVREAPGTVIPFRLVLAHGHPSPGNVLGPNVPACSDAPFRTSCRERRGR